jgi:hypothetical protein
MGLDALYLGLPLPGETVYIGIQSADGGETFILDLPRSTVDRGTHTDPAQPVMITPKSCV